MSVGSSSFWAYSFLSLRKFATSAIFLYPSPINGIASSIGMIFSLATIITDEIKRVASHSRSNGINSIVLPFIEIM